MLTAAAVSQAVLNRRGRLVCDVGDPFLCLRGESGFCGRGRDGELLSGSSENMGTKVLNGSG